MGHFSEHEAGQAESPEISAGAACDAASVHHPGAGAVFWKFLKFYRGQLPFLWREFEVGLLPPQLAANWLKLFRQLFSFFIFYNGAFFCHIQPVLYKRNDHNSRNLNKKRRCRAVLCWR